MSAPLDPRRNAFRADLADARLEGRVDAARFVEGKAMTVARPIAPLRREGRASATQETQALLGETVLVFEAHDDGWAWVQLDGDGYVGWMERAALSDRLAPATHRVCVPSTLLFPVPDIKQPVRAHLPMGARVAVGGEASDRNATYALVAPEGAVVVQHLQDLDAKAADFVVVAELFLGAPYLWGGKTPLGADCSGLVQTALGLAGIAAPRDTDMQERELGEAVAPYAPSKRGDLVFWPGHVGIMLDEARLLHANAFHMATRIEPLTEAVRRYEAKGVAISGIRRLSLG
ncbi:C40 family peptidase [Aureimonas psammosilenae]|uniref:C40 family peptidase n=1 Tax=Aureimonas psammosilenae TaxID=2495496 RepID=UPI0012607A8E|nr:C40 family peptidase [Aureimonas psammosilenae]